jgi:hypothetical protein
MPSAIDSVKFRLMHTIIIEFCVMTSDHMVTVQEEEYYCVFDFDFWIWFFLNVGAHIAKKRVNQKVFIV